MNDCLSYITCQSRSVAYFLVMLYLIIVIIEIDAIVLAAFFALLTASISSKLVIDFLVLGTVVTVHRRYVKLIK